MSWGAWSADQITQVWNNGQYSVDIRWKYRQDMAANKTNVVMMDLRINSLNASVYFNAYMAPIKAGFGDFAGHKTSGSYQPNVPPKGTGIVDLPDCSSIITHNADGSFPSGVCGWWMVNAAGEGFGVPVVNWSPFKVSVPGIVRGAPTTPRISSAKGLIPGVPWTISLPRDNSAFTHKVQVDFGTYHQVIATAATTSCTWTPPASLCDQIPNDVRGSGGVTAWTYLGSTLIGERSTPFILQVPTSPPSLTFEAVETNPALTVKGIVNAFGSGFHLKGLSRLQMTCSGKANYGASIRSIRFSTPWGSGSGSPFYITPTSAGNAALTCTVTDSRGLSTKKSVTVIVTDYSPPKLSSVSAWRISDGENLGINYRYDIVPLSNKNNRDLKIEYSTDNKTWVTLKDGVSSYTGTGPISTTGNLFKAASSYFVRLTAADLFRSDTQTIRIGPAFVLQNYGKSGRSVAFGKRSADNGQFEVAMPMQAQGIVASSIHAETVTATSAAAVGSLAFVDGSERWISMTYTSGKWTWGNKAAVKTLNAPGDGLYIIQSDFNFNNIGPYSFQIQVNGVAQGWDADMSTASVREVHKSVIVLKWLKKGDVLQPYVHTDKVLTGTVSLVYVRLL